MRKIYYFAALWNVLTLQPLLADPPEWDTDTIAQGSSSGVNVCVIVAPGPVQGQAVGVWSDVDTYAPYYSIYDDEGCTTGTIPLEVDGGISAEGVYDNIYVVAGPAAGQLVAAWSDSNSEYPYFSLYNDETWTTGTIPLNGSNGSYNDVTLASGPGSGQITAAWTNIGGGNHPYYSIYSSGSWTTGEITLGASTSVKNNVFVSTGPSTGTVAAVWTDRFTNVPYYSVYNSGTWTTTAISLGTSAGVFRDVTITQNPSNGQLLATWGDLTTQTPYYSIYSNGTWNTGVIPQGDSNGVLEEVYSSSGPSSDGFIAAWADKITSVAYYSIYSEGSWSTADIIPLDTSQGVNHNVTVAKIMGRSSIIAAWGQVVYQNTGYYSILESATPEPPATGNGKRYKNRFALEVEWYNQLVWTASPSEGVAGYNIRRDGILIASEVNALTYQDHNRPKKGIELYVITSVDEEGNESSSGLEIIVQ